MIAAEAILWLAAFVIVYFLPLIAANLRGHHNQLAIAGLNLLAGWTVLGWIAAMVWSLTSNVEGKES